MGPYSHGNALAIMAKPPFEVRGYPRHKLEGNSASPSRYSLPGRPGARVAPERRVLRACPGPQWERVRGASGLWQIDRPENTGTTPSGGRGPLAPCARSAAVLRLLGEEVPEALEQLREKVLPKFRKAFELLHGEDRLLLAHPSPKKA